MLENEKTELNLLPIDLTHAERHDIVFDDIDFVTPNESMKSAGMNEKT